MGGIRFKWVFGDFSPELGEYLSNAWYLLNGNFKLRIILRKIGFDPRNKAPKCFLGSDDAMAGSLLQ